MSIRTNVDHQRIAELCRRWKITELALFGSVLRNDFGPHSDIDVLVKFEQGQTPGLTFFTIQNELSAVFGRTVDLHTPKGLSRHFAEEVLAEAEPVYVAA